MEDITILFFGSIRDITGKGSESVENPGSLDELKDQLISRYPVLETYTYQFSVNRRLVSGNQILSAGDEVALLPPFAGG